MRSEIQCSLQAITENSEEGHAVRDSGRVTSGKANSAMLEGLKSKDAQQRCCGGHHNEDKNQEE
jgi:hypothetical protein